MNTKRLIAASALFAVTLLLAVPAVVAQTEAEPEITRHAYQMNANGTFSLRNVNGSVTVHAWDQPSVEIVATKKGRSKEQMDMVKIEIVADLKQVSVETSYPRSEHNLNVSVNYEVKVPRMALLRDIETVNGSVEIDGVAGEIETQTVNGSVKVLNAAGRVSAETVNGSISVELQKADSNSDMKLETVNGSIKLYLTDQVNADVTAETVHGSVNSDYPMNVESSKFIGTKKMNGTLGKGGARIRMETVNGSVNVFRR
jgi:DUF4097 and DUF4098 domain-containing protein YvlB